MKNNSFEISVTGLPAGESTLFAHADKEFFAKFENYEVLSADLKVTLVADKSREALKMECSISGTITVPCDRCLAPVAIPVDTVSLLKLRFGGDSAAVEEPWEEVFLEEGSDRLNLDQEIYDFSLLALPLQKFHKEGECDKAALDCLSTEDTAEDSSEATDTPFANLADLFKTNK